MYTVAVCDDDREFNQSMVRMCRAVLDKTGIQYSLKSFFCEEDVMRDISHGGKTDLMFIDIRLGRKNGIDLARKLKERGEDTSVVLMTEDSSFLLAGYSVQPVYFLMKPIDPEELEKAFKADLKRRQQSMNIFIRCERKHVPIPVDSIIYVEIIDHAITIHTRTKDYTTRMTFSQLLDELPPSTFARCHNSYAVNLSRVSHFSRALGITLDNRVTLPIGRKYFDHFRQCFIQFIDTY